MRCDVNSISTDMQYLSYSTKISANKTIVKAIHNRHYIIYKFVRENVWNIIIYITDKTAMNFTAYT